MKVFLKIMLGSALISSINLAFADTPICPSTDKIQAQQFKIAYYNARYSQWNFMSTFEYNSRTWSIRFDTNLNEKVSENNIKEALKLGNEKFKQVSLFATPITPAPDEVLFCTYADNADYSVQAEPLYAVHH